MLTIRLNRVGKKNKPYFRIILQEHTIAPGGRHVDVLGSYDPHAKKAVLKEEKIKYWLEKGAQASDTVYNLFVKNGIITGEKRKVKIPAKGKSSTAEDKKDKKEEGAVIAKAETDKKEDEKEETKKEETPAEVEAKEEAKEEKTEVPATEETPKAE